MFVSAHLCSAALDYCRCSRGQNLLAFALASNAWLGTEGLQQWLCAVITYINIIVTLYFKKFVNYILSSLLLTYLPTLISFFQ